MFENAGEVAGLVVNGLNNLLVLAANIQKILE